MSQGFEMVSSAKCHSRNSLVSFSLREHLSLFDFLGKGEAILSIRRPIIDLVQPKANLVVAYPSGSCASMGAANPKSITCRMKLHF